MEAGVECQASCGPGRDSREKRACVEGGRGQSTTLAMINAARALQGAATVPAPACCTQGSAIAPRLEECMQILSSLSQDPTECPSVCSSLSSSPCTPASPASSHSPTDSQRFLASSRPPPLAPWVLPAPKPCQLPPTPLGSLRRQFCPGRPPPLFRGPAAHGLSGHGLCPHLHGHR